MLKSSFVYVLLGFLPVAANFLLAPIYTHYLPPSEYALVGVSTLFQTFLTFFISLSLDGAFSRFYFTYIRKPRLLHTLLSTVLATVTLASTLVLVLLLASGDVLFSYLFSNTRFSFTGLGVWVFFTTYANIIFLIFLSMYRNAEKVGLFALCSALFFVVPVLGTLIGLIYFEAGAEGSIIGRALGSIAVAVSLLIAYFARRPIVFRMRFLRTALTYSLPLIPYQLMFAGFSNLDRIILEQSFPSDVFGVYNFAVSISALVLVFLTAVSNVLTPKIYNELTTGGNKEKVRQLIFIMVYSIMAVVCISIAGLVPAMQVFIGAAYAPAYEYIGTLFLSYLPYLHYLVWSVPLFFFGKTKAFPFVSFAALASGLLFNWLLVPVLGIWAVCLSLYVIRAVQAAVGYFFNRRYGYTAELYVRQDQLLLGSAIIIAAYNVFLFGGFALGGMNIIYVNLVPAVAFGLVSILLYRQDLGTLWRHIHKGSLGKNMV